MDGGVRRRPSFVSTPEEPPLPIPSYGPPISAGAEYMKLTHPTLGSAPESALLKSIRQALSVTTPVPSETPHRTLSSSLDGEEELYWLDKTVIWSVGNVQRRKWVFDTEKKDRVLWVTWANFPSEKFSSSDAEVDRLMKEFRTYTMSPKPAVYTASPTTDEDYISTFGRFSAIRPPTSEEAADAQSFVNSKKDQGKVKTTPCICIFLTSFVVIYTKDGGIEYTANLPFHTRRVWQLSGLGLLIERVVGQDEYEGDLVPTVFTLTGPYDEFSTLGFAYGIEGGVDSVPNMSNSNTIAKPTKKVVPLVIRKEPPTDVDETPASRSLLRSFAKTERVVFSSDQPGAVCGYIVATHDPVQHVVRIWRYAHDRSDSDLKKAESKQRNSDVANPEQADEVWISQPLNPTDIFPVTKTQDTITATLALAQETAEPQLQRTRTSGRPTHIRQTSQTRNELSVTLDRMALGGAGEDLLRRIGEPGITNRLGMVDRGFRAEFWFTCVHEIAVGEIGYEILDGFESSFDALALDRKPDGDVEVCMYDVRLDLGKLAITAPAKGCILTASVLLQDNTVTCHNLRTIPGLSTVALTCIRPNQYDLLVVRPSGTLSLFTNDYQEYPLRLNMDRGDIEMSDAMSSPQPGFPPNNGPLPVQVKDAVKSSATVVFSDGTQSRISLNFLPGPFVYSIFVALSYALPASITASIRRRYLRRWLATGKSYILEDESACCFEAIMEKLGDENIGGPVHGNQLGRVASMIIVSDVWVRSSGTLTHRRLSKDTALRHLARPHPTDIAPTSETSPLDRVRLPRRVTNPPSWAASAMQALHILAESYQISIGKQTEMKLLASLLVRMGRYVAMDWSNYWALHVPEDPDAWAPAEAYGFQPHPQLPIKPPTMIDFICGQASNQNGPRSLISLAHVHTLYGQPPSLEYGPARINPMSRIISEAYEQLTNFVMMPTAIERAKAAVTVLYHHGLSAEDICRLPFGMGTPLKEALSLCREYPPPDWDPAQYLLIDRIDLAKMSGYEWNRGTWFGESYRYKQEARYKDEREILGTIIKDAKSAASGPANIDPEGSLLNSEFTDIRFGMDRRLQEVDRMLQSSALTTVRILERADLNEHDLAKEQHQFALIISERTLALSIGRAMYTYGSLQSVGSDFFSIHKINLAVRMVPQGVTINVDQAKNIAPDARMWGEFHNGAAAALRIARETSGVDSTWIAFNRPNDLTPEHAGFILGLGLNGHLADMLTWHAFSYLTPKHEMTTVAMLVGLAASHVGRGDALVTKMLALHTPALLPPGAPEMNLGLWTQMAGLMGVGILFLGRKDRRMAECCLNEIGGRDFGSQLDVTNENREAYSVTAALAFGLIMCGHGAQANSPADVDIVARLRILIHGQSNGSDKSKYLPYFNVNLTSPAASIALAMMFIKTERADIAGLFEVAYTPLALSRIAPNLLLIRTLSRLLIFWSAITPSVPWVTTQVPLNMANNEELEGYDDAVKDSYDLAYYNIVAGVCFATALKYAGSADHAARTTLIHYYDAFSKSAYQRAPTFDAQIKRSAVRDALNLISLCVGMVMSGTGELNVLRRLRYAHGQLMPYVKYGSHMTSHMSLGMLFLGGGRYTFGTSNASIACLIAAFYPRWPNNAGDNKGMLPVFRHLWCLAVEPRCLIARDADSGETVYIPVKIKVQDGDSVKVHQYMSPSLIPDFNKLLSITVDSSLYWPFSIDFADPKTLRFAMNVLAHQTIWVKRRSGYLGYGEDPRGNRSILAFIGLQISDTSTAGYFEGTETERMLAISELGDFITSFSVDTRTISFADWICHARPKSLLEAKALSYCQQGLLECLLHDKAVSLPTLLNIFQIRFAVTEDGMTGSKLPSMMLSNLKFLSRYYRYLHNRSFGGRIGKERSLRPSLIRLTLLQAAENAIDDRVQKLRVDETFMQTLSEYVRRGDLRTMLSLYPPDLRVRLPRQLAVYLINECVPGTDMLEALARIISDIRSRRKITSSGEVLEEEKLRKSLQTITHSVLLDSSQTPLWELSSRAFDDVVKAKGL